MTYMEELAQFGEPIKWEELPNFQGKEILLVTFSLYPKNRMKLFKEIVMVNEIKHDRVKLSEKEYGKKFKGFNNTQWQIYQLS